MFVKENVVEPFRKKKSLRPSFQDQEKGPGMISRITLFLFENVGHLLHVITDELLLYQRLQ
jgi:hypothetical protein